MKRAWFAVIAEILTREAMDDWDEDEYAVHAQEMRAAALRVAAGAKKLKILRPRHPRSIKWAKRVATVMRSGVRKLVKNSRVDIRVFLLSVRCFALHSKMCRHSPHGWCVAELDE